MADLDTVALKVKVEGIENFRTALSSAATKINRIQHLFNELNAVITDLENDVNNISFKLIPYSEGEANARQQQALGGQKEASGPKAGGVQRQATGQHQEAQESEGDS